ncbi:MAG: 3-isopropylmalate dehydrogenase [Bacteroidetes bacterium]|jgi:3-isopropylmalate dehydrogenase|nr:3-isopropylmalate dehydrogenase [Bacteroidota bacterium]MBT3748200.1 3-isopropylmalate dehydrogenase [Bacteroidota bacterium]MBT7095029.1 3-isopropylmalate dehydrogenase [Bacteroidota bacterium]MBT7466181.1 3-isopropylmalate dehydrogenase [Bacteroidota bacterium]
MKAKIALLSGDGIGPEIMVQGVKVLNTIAEKYNHEFIYREGLIGGAAIDATGIPYPDDTHELCLNADAILFGAIGDPKYDNNPSATVRPEQGLLAMRKKLGLYANLRPVRTFPSLFDKSPLKSDRLEGVDFMVVRELTGGIYFGQPSEIDEEGMNSVDTCLYSKDEILRAARIAFDLAGNSRNKLTLVDKANVLATSRLWRKTVQELAPEYPEVEVEYLFVDNAAMQLIIRPNQFDVILTENMFGDILTDEASVLPGSIGLQPSASVGDKTSVFEPIHGSYPQASGKHIANPYGMILSVAMMLDKQFSLKNEAGIIVKAVEEALDTGFGTVDLFPNQPVSTELAGQFIIDYIKRI